MRQFRTVPLTALDAGGISRCLAQLAGRPGDRPDAFFEVVEATRFRPDGESPRRAVRREAGLAVRLTRGGRSWLASCDAVDSAAFRDAVGRVARVRPAAWVLPGGIELGPMPVDELELETLPERVREAIKRRHVAFPTRIEAFRRRRWVRAVGSVLAPEQEREELVGLVVRTPWGRWGGLFPGLAEEAAEHAALALLARFAARDARPPSAGRSDIVLGPAAAAVLLHEAVAHALEVDRPLRRPAVAPGTRLGAACLSVLDDPPGAPEAVRRLVDDEAVPAVRRWLLREGVVEQPLADLAHAADSEERLPGAARRSSRHRLPVPRSHHLEVTPGESSEEELLAAARGGLYVAEVAGGRLDPEGGRLVLEVSCGRRIGAAGLEEPVGRFRLVGGVGEVLASVAAVGRETRRTAAGWCAKGGDRLPVWATAAALLLENVEVTA
jgi:hypothetical protein